jgi:hypothetical protein
MSVVINTTVPSSQLKKKHNAIAYHRIRESIAARIVTFAHISTKDNLADMLTKPIPNEDFQRLTHLVLFRKVSYNLGKEDEPKSEGKENESQQLNKDKEKSEDAMRPEEE